MKKALQLWFVYIFLFNIYSFSVASNEEVLFYQAEGFLNDANYKKALPLFKSIKISNTDNYNVAYKLGVCYLFSEVEKQKAIIHLKEASDHTSVNCKENLFKEKMAPPMALYYLGIAYHINYQFKEAIECFINYKKYIEKDKLMQLSLERQLQISEQAKSLVANPVKIEIKNLGDSINTKYDDYSAVIAADESIIAFTSRRPENIGGKIDEEDDDYFEDIYISSKNEKGNWRQASNIGTSINSASHEATIGMSADAQRLIIYKDDNGDGNIYTSDLEGKNWSIPQKLNENINTEFWEPSASISSDGEVMYFTSNKPGGYGGRDIYRSKRLPNGKWGKAINLGPIVNTAFDEDAPFIHPDNKTLYFSSNGHNTMGGFDIFYTSVADSAVWSKPLNLGYPINSTEDDLFFITSPDNKRAYYSSSKQGGFGKEDIYMLSLVSLSETFLTVYSGEIKNEFGQVPEGVEITIVDNETGETVGKYYPNSLTGKYLFILTPGKNYNITYEADGYLFHSENMEVAEQSAYANIEKPINLNLIKTGAKTILKNIFFDFDKATLQSISYAELEKLYKLMSKHAGLVVEISGHTDSKGNDEYNVKLSQQRAETVVNFLHQRGISKNRLFARGYGEVSYIANNDTDQGRQLNRRVEFKILNAGTEMDVVEKIKIPDNLSPQKNK